MKKGKRMSEEHKQKIREARKGYKHTEEAKQKMRKKALGRLSFWKGKKNPTTLKRNLENNWMNGRTGNKHPNWKGGKIVNNGYIYVYHELGRHFGGKYIKRADLVWFEAKGELICSPFELHHINGDRQDDRIENLVKLKKSEHSFHHIKEKYEKMIKAKEEKKKK